MTWQMVCALGQLTDPGAREFTVGAGDWPLRGFVVRYQGQLHAYVNRCPHARLPLNLKPNEFFAPDMPLLQCTAHGALFAPQTGECVAGPCAGKALQRVSVQLRADHVEINAVSVMQGTINGLE